MKYFLFQGNSNNFQTKEDCFRACHPEEEDFQITESDSISPDPNISKGDDDDDDSFPFFLPFPMEPEGKAVTICRREADPGPCRPQDPAKYFKRFHFNQTSSSCEIFLYGGCGGNHNNFENKTDCQAFCGVSSTPEESQAATFDSQNCVKSPKHGRCHLSEPRWFFSHWDNICKPYNYSGCGANMNSFLRYCFKLRYFFLRYFFP